MDPALLAMAPTAGVTGILLTFLGLQFKQAYADRKQYLDHADRADARATAAEAKAEAEQARRWVLEEENARLRIQLTNAPQGTP